MFIDTDMKDGENMDIKTKNNINQSDNNYQCPILTIAIPTYNGSKTIKSMLNVLMPQVTDKVEILVSDNCSTDDTLQVVYKYKKKYPLFG